MGSGEFGFEISDTEKLVTQRISEVAQRTTEENKK